MKKLAVIFLCLGLISFSAANAQVKEEVKKDAKKVGHKTAEVASKTKAAVVDKRYRDKEGPDGQTIYIDKHSKYYWIDDKGKKQYIAKSALKDKKKG